jgi:hypothetical protein
MEINYGPWAMPIEANSNPQLSSFWKRRIKMLVPVSQTCHTLSRRNLLWLGAAALLLAVLPTFHSAPVAADENKWDREIKKAIESAGAAEEGVIPKKAEDAERVKKKSAETPAKLYVIKVWLIDEKGIALAAPRMTTHEDQEVSMEDCSQSPFVIGVSSTEDGKKPHIVVLKEGTAIKATIAGPKFDGATLDITVERSKIGNVDTKEVGSDEKIQLPSLETQKKRIIDFVKYGEIFSISTKEKSAAGDDSRIELVFGPAETIEKLPDSKAPAAKSLPDAKALRR